MSRRGMKLVFFLAVAVLAVCCTWASGASAQTYPSRAVRMVVPYTPGGPADGVARVLSESLSNDGASQWSSKIGPVRVAI